MLLSLTPSLKPPAALRSRYLTACPWRNRSKDLRVSVAPSKGWPKACFKSMYCCKAGASRDENVVGLCQEDAQASCCAKDEGRPFEVTLQEEASNRHKRLRS